MGNNIDPHLVNFTYEAAFKSFWGKNALRRFLKSCNISAALLATWSSGESKGEFLNRLIQILLKSEKGQVVFNRIAVKLSELNTFPDLQNLNDSAKKISEAKVAISKLRSYLDKKLETEDINFEKGEIQPLLYEQKRKEFQTRLDAMKDLMGNKEGEFQFSSWFYDLLDFCKIENKRPKIGDNKPIDGTLVHKGLSYMVDSNFTPTPYEKKLVRRFRKIIEGSNDHNIGIVISISGYSSDAIESSSRKSPPLILMNVNHLYLFLTGVMDFSEIINRMYRHLSRTGEATLPVNKIWMMDYDENG